MQEFINAFHFLRPWWLLLLVIPLFFYGRYLRGASNQSSWEKVCDKRLLDYLLIRGSSTQRKVMAWTALIGLVTGIVAAAGPSWKKIEIPSLAPENPLMIVLNLSTDMKGKDLTPSRLERAKFKIQDLLKLIPDSQSGLIVYTNEPFLISPLTSDGEILTNLLPAVSSKTQTIMSIQKNLEKCFSSEALPICHKLPDLMDIFSKSFKKGIFNASP